MTESMWNCPRCGARNELFRSGCRKCGSARDEALRSNKELALAPPAPRPPRSGRPLAVVAILVVVAFAGAGAFVFLRPDDSSKVPVAAADPRTQQQIYADALAAQAIQLPLADFPAEWHTKPRSHNEHDADEEKTLQSFEICMGDAGAAVLAEDSDTPGKAETDEFVSDRSDMSAQADVSLQPSIEAAQEEFAMLHRPQLADCFGSLMNATVRHAVEHPAPGKEVPAGVSFGDAVVTVSNMADVHADTIALRATVEVTGPRGSITEVFDFIFAQKGRTDMTLFLFNVGDPFPGELAVHLLNTMADRIPDV